MSRTLKSKRLKSALWIAANGKCQICGCDLPEGWHADHIEPWSKTGRTNVHEMQALCARCNLQKGTFSMRRFQDDFSRICREIATGVIEAPEWIFCHVAPGGGKSSLPVIAAYWLTERSKFADKICWVVPNGSLREQGAAAFGPTKIISKLLKHNLEICESINSVNPSKGKAGYITTYQALNADAPFINRDELKTRRYILVLDEFHHLAHGEAFHKAVQSLVENSVLTICMTGTVERADRCPIYPLIYDSKRLVCKEDSSTEKWVNYSIRQATLERAIIRVHFEHIDGKSEWFDRNGDRKKADKLGFDKDALFTALQTEYACELLDSCLDHWTTFRRSNPRSKMLVVCSNVEQAKRMTKRIRDRGVSDVKIATYKEIDAEDSIRDFRETAVPSVLVTVAKAYEGMDCPPITHLACLTHIRSKPWIEQMIARGWRYDQDDPRPWESQYLYAFLPADEHMKVCIQEIEDEQHKAAKDLDERPRSRSEMSDHDPKNDGCPDDGTIPLSSRATDFCWSELNGEAMSQEEARIYKRICVELGLPISPLQLKTACEAKDKAFTDEPEMSESEPLYTTPGLRIRKLRSALDNAVKRAAKGDGERCLMINARIKARFGDRDAIDETKLCEAIKWLRTSYQNA